MKKELLAILNDVRSDEKVAYYDVNRIKQAIVLRILQTLGWDIFNVDEVFPDYPVGNDRVDFSLRYDNENMVFVGITGPNEDLTANYINQLLALSREATAKIAVLTNGVEWQLFLPLRESEDDKFKFHTLHLFKQDPDDLVKKFVDYLSREHVRKGKAWEDAEKVFRSRKKKRLIKEALLDVWNENITGDDRTLVGMMAEEAEKRCGYPPESDLVINFMKMLKKGGRRKTSQLKSGKKKTARKKKKTTTKTRKGRPAKKTTARKGRKTATKAKRETFIGKKPKSFTFLGQKQKVRKWKEILTNVCNILAKAKGAEFERVLSLMGRKRRYFSRIPDNLKEPRLVSGTDIYVETNFNAQNLIMITYKVLKAFGYTESDISFETK